MSAKTLIIAAALAASTATTLPALAAGGDGTGPAQDAGAGPNPPPAADTLPLRAQILFGLHDTNNDGAVDTAEFAKLSDTIFKALDKNDDGKLTADELRIRFGPMVAERFGQRDGRGADRHHWRPHRMGAMAGPMGPGPRLDFADIDTNHDGAISQDEFEAHQPGPGQGRNFGPRR